MKQGWKTMGAGLLLLGAAATAQEAVTTADLVKIIERQNQQIAQLSDRLGQLEEMKAVLKETTDAYAEQSKTIDKLGKKLSLGNNIDGLKLTGDLRARYEFRDQNVAEPKSASKAEDSSEDRGRFRTRFRVGLVWNNKTESWEIGAGLASGGDDGRSSNDTWGETNMFETGDIRLDYAYATHKWLLENGMPLSLTLGQMKNPFVTTFINWDDDLRPTGIAAQIGDPFGKDYSGFFATVGAFNALWGPNANKVNNDTDVYLYAGQIGYKYQGESFNALVAAGLRHITMSALEDVTKSGKYSYWNDKDKDGVVDAGEIATVNDYDPFKTSAGLYNIVEEDYTGDYGDLYGEISTNWQGVTWKGYGHVAMNFGADGTVSQQLIASDEMPEDNNLAWLLGGEAKYQRLTFGYGYAHIEADSVFGPLKDSDFGETAGLVDTDVQGHKLYATYNVTKNFTIGATAYLLERIEGGSDEFEGKSKNDEADSTTCFQIDAVYKF